MLFQSFEGLEDSARSFEGLKDWMQSSFNPWRIKNVIIQGWRIAFAILRRIEGLHAILRRVERSNSQSFEGMKDYVGDCMQSFCDPLKGWRIPWNPSKGWRIPCNPSTMCSNYLLWLWMGLILSAPLNLIAWLHCPQNDSKMFYVFWCRFEGYFLASIKNLVSFFDSRSYSEVKCEKW